ncbi:hypothetical protein [Mesorhizobium delmotii]|uniref:Uncharacterized protein n=1 Tax=Mesorhizobium delmotii TaxID=1631247 RepID=A0A2P9ANV5_9HYPH|nr:hypothetical protein [Mesorhizobium delmotii]SJM32849.1 conserved exported hypothetical protein [Mesorhizobium delmotii]
MLRPILLATILAAAIAPAAAYSNAANYLIAEQIASACEGNVGEIDPSSVIERDLTGDGKADLILSHEGINCSAGASTSRSSFCGAQICAVDIYVRRGALLELKTEMLGAGVSVGEGQVPEIRMHAHGGEAATLKWDGREFR